VAFILQDEFKFYLEDVKSKLVLVPPKGFKLAEQAAAELGVPVAEVSLVKGPGKHSPPSHACTASTLSFTACHRIS
jgi:hypothetical protein